MLFRLFTIYDSKVEAYLPPFHFRSRGEALRNFIDACNDPQQNLFSHPEDFTLFALGEFDDGNAEYTLLKTPEPIAKAIECKNPEKTITDLPQLNLLQKETA